MYHPHTIIYMCCDNNEVLDQIKNQVPLQLNPNQTVANEYGIYCEIFMAQQQTPPTPTVLLPRSRPSRLYKLRQAIVTN